MTGRARSDNISSFAHAGVIPVTGAEVYHSLAAAGHMATAEQQRDTSAHSSSATTAAADGLDQMQQPQQLVVVVKEVLLLDHTTGVCSSGC